MPTWLKKTLIVCLWLLVWQLAALAIANDILLASPIQTFIALLKNLVTVGFWSAIGFSMLRIFLGFAIAFTLALLLGALAARWSLLAELLNPAVTFVKSVPVVCFIVMLLIWFGSRWVSLSAVFLVAFPAFYFAVLEGLSQRDKKLNEMLTVFQLSGRRKLAAYHWPSVLPFVQAASKTAVGMSWKSGIAAEVIGLPMGSIGEGIYRGKILLNSADVFAWTVVVVVISVLAELVFLKLLERSGDWSWAWALPQTFSTTQAGQTKNQAPATTITARNLTKAYGEKTVLASLNLELAAGQRYVISSPSGTGKTTLLRLLAGLDHPDSGMLNNANQAAIVFQEARLFEQRSAIQNIQLVVGQYVDLPTIRSVVACLLPTDALDLAVDQLSGGMRRRVELCRALLFPSKLLLLDEPFAGLDSANSAMAQELIMGMLDGRTLVISSHDLEDIEALGCQVISPK